MAISIVKHDYNGSQIQQRTSDDFVCLTDMAKAEGRRVGDYLDLPKVKDYIAALAVDLNSLPDYLVVSIRDGSTQRTWAHPEVAMDFAQWVSIPFRIWANRTLVQVVKERALPPADIRVKDLAESLQAFGIDLTNPRYQQEIQDYALNLIIGTQKQVAESKDNWTGVVEIASDMGYATSLASKWRSQLGKFIASFDFESRKEKRLCNGGMHPINLYHDCEELRNAIAEFLDAKVLASTSEF